MRRVLIPLAALVVLLSAVVLADDSRLLLLLSSNTNTPTGNCSNISDLHPEDVLCVPENITGTLN